MNAKMQNTSKHLAQGREAVSLENEDNVIKPNINSSTLASGSYTIGHLRFMNITIFPDAKCVPFRPLISLYSLLSLNFAYSSHLLICYQYT